MGGGTYVHRMLVRGGHGLSPRGRGNLENGAEIEVLRRSIPAWAGEPISVSSAERPSSVYPRVGGGTVRASASLAKPAGLSPRGRGNRLGLPQRRWELRSIPAWAGEPSRATSTTLGTTVYPRVGGGTRWPLSADRRKAGLSPRGRGNRVQAQRPRPPEGSIPAWAGEPYPAVASNSCVTVYPRVGGGTHVKSLGCHCQGGLSPRGRGNLKEPFDL